MLRPSKSIAKIVSLLLLLLLIQPFVLATPDEDYLKKWESFDFSKRSVELKDIQDLPL